jgi:four helix bundle protein
MEKDEYNLEERLAKFAEKIIDLMKKLPQDAINLRMIGQVVASGGSAGANYNEANEAESKKDFTHKTILVKKELKETRHWLRLLTRANPSFKDEFAEIREENRELLLIFSRIVNSCRGKNN